MASAVAKMFGTVFDNKEHGKVASNFVFINQLKLLIFNIDLDDKAASLLYPNYSNNFGDFGNNQ